jgi:hypothetical protein
VTSTTDERSTLPAFFHGDPDFNSLTSGSQGSPSSSLVLFFISPSLSPFWCWCRYLPWGNLAEQWRRLLAECKRERRDGEEELVARWRRRWTRYALKHAGKTFKSDCCKFERVSSIQKRRDKVFRTQLALSVPLSTHTHAHAHTLLPLRYYHCTARDTLILLSVFNQLTHSPRHPFQQLYPFSTNKQPTKQKQTPPKKKKKKKKWGR